MAEKTVSTEIEKQEEQTPATREPSRYLIPPVDIYETEDGLTVMADMPGVTKDNVNLRVDNNVLTLRGNVDHQHPGDAMAREFELHDFFRQFELSEEIDQEKIEARLNQGVLTVYLPKAEKAKPKQVEIAVG
ncbi:MAG: Hsp20/alpha crystallin family protein [Candidatus Sumerlaeia bacterium]